jgi:hypothetical protein
VAQLADVAVQLRDVAAQEGYLAAGSVSRYCGSVGGCGGWLS